MLCVGMQTAATTMQNSAKGPQKTGKGITEGPSNSTSGFMSEETQHTNPKEYMLPYVHCSIIYSCQDMEVAQVSISRRMGKLSCGTFAPWNPTPPQKENEIFPFATMGGPSEINEINQSETDKCHVISPNT